MNGSERRATVSVGGGTGAAAEELRLPGLLLGAAATVGLFIVLAAALAALPAARILPGYAEWLSEIPHGPGERLQWVLGDVSEPQFYKSWIASLGLLLGATGAWCAARKGSRWAGEPLAYGSGLWLWTLAAAGLGLVLSNAVAGSSLREGWQPTFVPFVSVPAAVVLVYGAGVAKALTGAVIGAAITPLAMVLISRVGGPLGLPAVVGCTAAMSVGAVVAFMLCRHLPWMTRPRAGSASVPRPAAIRARSTVLGDAAWTIRRILKDFTEAQFYANEWASLGLLAGVVLTALASQDLAAYGTGLLPQILVAQALTSAIGIVVWRGWYRYGGWAPTYVPLVSVAPASVLAFGGSWLPLIVGAAGGALLCPVIARFVAGHLPSDHHPFIGNTVAMAIGTATLVPTLGLIA